MKWRKFSEKKPKENSELYIRSYVWKKLHFDERVTFSSGTLWLGGNLALSQEYYEWLDESEDVCKCCGK